MLKTKISYIKNKSN